jgi:hypothetical protein
MARIFLPAAWLSSVQPVRYWKHNFQVIPGVKWLQLLIQHILDNHAHLVRHYAACSNRWRDGHNADHDTPVPTIANGEMSMNQTGIVKPGTQAEKHTSPRAPDFL